MRAKVKKVIKNCNICKVYSTKPYGLPSISALPEYRTEGSRPFEVTGVDFARPFLYKVGKREEGKCYVIIFTCACSRVVDLEVASTQTADEFKSKLNAFISRRTRPRIIISDNAKVFKATADWIKTVRRSEKLQNYLARENIRWQFNLAKSPWWGGIYERLIKEIKKTLHKTLGRSHLSCEAFESVIMHIERNLPVNDRPLTCFEAYEVEEVVLTPNMILWGDVYTVEDTESSDAEKLTKVAKRLENAKANAWKRWKREYVHSLIESHRLNKETGTIPQVGEIVLILGDERTAENGERVEWCVLSKAKMTSLER